MFSKSVAFTWLALALASVSVQGLPQLRARQSDPSVSVDASPSTSIDDSPSITISATISDFSSVAASASALSDSQPSVASATGDGPTFSSPGPVPVQTDPSIAAALLNEPSSVDRFKKYLTDDNGNLLTGDALRQKTVFDFNQQKPAPGSEGGSILLATVDNFPILTGLGVAGAVSFVGPCGLNIPHSHPRANEFFTVVEGVLETGLVLENGFNQDIPTVLGKYQGTVFPKGSIHYQQNPTCEQAVFVASFDNNDPGRSDIVTSLWMFDSDIIDASLGFPETIGGESIDQWRSHLPVNLALGVDTCLQKCGIQKNATTSTGTDD